MADRIVILKDGVVQQVGTPQQVYNEPVNAFVAGFIGSPTMNFLVARVQAEGLALADGTLLPLPPGRHATLGGRAAVQLGVRPEHLLLAPPGPHRLQVQARVVEPLGSDTLVYFDFAGARHVARVAPEHTPQVGQALHLGIALERAHLFDEASGLVLR